MKLKSLLWSLSLVALLGGVSACITTLGGGQREAGEKKKVKNGSAVIYVSEDPSLGGDQVSAQFQFEIDTDGLWAWNQINENEVEYSLYFEFEVDHTTYRVGFSHFSFNENGVGIGSFNQLIRDHGQLSLWKKMADGSYVSEFDMKPRISAHVNSKGLLLSLSGGILDRIKDRKLGTVHWVARGHYLQASKGDVNVTYVY